jgi:hypothetical protein
VKAGEEKLLVAPPPTPLTCACLVRTEKQQLVLHHWTAKREAELVLFEHTSWLTCSVSEKIVRIENIVAQEFEDRAVEFITSTLGHNVDVGAGVAPKRRVELTGLDLEFLNGSGLGPPRRR